MKFLVNGIFLYVILMLIVKEKNGLVSSTWSNSARNSNWEPIREEDEFEWIDHEDQNSMAQEEQVPLEISCVSDRDGSRICDCGFRNEVSLNNYYFFSMIR